MVVGYTRNISCFRKKNYISYNKCSCCSSAFLPSISPSFHFLLLLSLLLREKYVLELQSPRYTRLRDWHHQRSAHVLNVQS